MATLNDVRRHAGGREMASARQRGMTLIELLVAVVVIGILSAIAITSYRAQVVKSRRAAAATCLQEGVQAIERYYTQNMSYTGFTDAMLPGCDADPDEEFYTIRLNGTANAKNFSLIADPQGTQDSSDTTCGNLTINQAGDRAPEDTECW